MKTVKIALTAIALATVPFASIAADLVNQAPLQQQQAGVVSVTGVNNLDSLQAELAAKADAAGAKSFRITSASGNNQLHGTAVIYQ